MLRLAGWFMYAIGIWTLVLIVAGMLRRQDLEIVTGGSWGRVLAIVPAHNEAVVIAETIDCLLESGCTVVVICDRCSDATVWIARQHGAFVFEVNEGNKAAAINRYLRQSDVPECFASVSIVDCGTLVGPEYADRVGRALVKYRFVQGWLRSSGRLSAVHTWYVWQYGLAHLENLGREVFRLPVFLGGTGCAWRSSEAVSFDERCLVEDLELSVRLHRAGVSIGYVDMGVVDEKPSSLRVSLIQLLRWARGGWWLVLHGRWFTWRWDDLVAVLGILAQPVFAYFLVRSLFVAPLAVAVLEGVWIVLGTVGLLRLRSGWTSGSLLLVVPAMSIVSGIISLAALVTVNRRTWDRTLHTASVEL